LPLGAGGERQYTAMGDTSQGNWSQKKGIRFGAAASDGEDELALVRATDFWPLARD